jgi:chlorite dismutase
MKKYCHKSSIFQARLITEEELSIYNDSLKNLNADIKRYDRMIQLNDNPKTYITPENVLHWHSPQLGDYICQYEIDRLNNWYIIPKGLMEKTCEQILF